MIEAISAQHFVGIIFLLVSALGTVTWFMFRGLYRQVERLTVKLDENTAMRNAWQLDEERRLHDMEVRIINRIDQMDESQDKMARDIAILYTRVGTLEMKVSMLHEDEGND
nr:MAG TPA: hypothetical protein [Caudoviricetes sp.]